MEGGKPIINPGREGIRWQPFSTPLSCLITVLIGFLSSWSDKTIVIVSYLAINLVVLYLK